MNFGELAASRYVRIATLVLIVQATLFYSTSHGDAMKLAAPLAAFPTTVGDWTRVGQDQAVEPETLEILKADDTLFRVYRDSKGHGASLWIAYFETQRRGQSPHSPKNCLPGSGYEQIENDKVDVPIGAQTIRINHYAVAKGDEQSVVYYWYQSHGRVIADEFAAKFYLIADSIKMHRSDTALVRVVGPVNPQDRERSEAAALEFVKTVYPAVKAFLPR